MKLKKWIYIVLISIMLIVLVFFTIKRLNIKIPTPVDNQYCGDQICQFNENQDNCCKDCGCPSGQVCINNTCEISTTTTTSSITQTTESQPGSSESPSTEEGESSGEAQTTETTTTTLYMGCSINNCEACENATSCYNVGCIWCKVSNRCRIICKG